MPDPRATMAMNEPDRAWRGTAAELAREAARRLDGIGLTEQRLNERQVRYYVAEGVLTRPARAGRFEELDSVRRRSSRTAKRRRQKQARTSGIRGAFM